MWPGQFFGWDNLVGFGTDNSPRLPVQTLEETPEYRIHTTAWGCTMRNWTHHGGVPEFLDFTIKDRDSWAKAKARMTPARDRIDWKNLARPDILRKMRERNTEVSEGDALSALDERPHVRLAEAPACRCPAAPVTATCPGTSILASRRASMSANAISS